MSVALSSRVVEPLLPKKFVKKCMRKSESFEIGTSFSSGHSVPRISVSCSVPSFLPHLGSYTPNSVASIIPTRPLHTLSPILHKHPRRIIALQIQADSLRATASVDSTDLGTCTIRALGALANTVTGSVASTESDTFGGCVATTASNNVAAGLECAANGTVTAGIGRTGEGYGDGGCCLGGSCFGDSGEGSDGGRRLSNGFRKSGCSGGERDLGPDARATGRDERGVNGLDCRLKGNGRSSDGNATLGHSSGGHSSGNCKSRQCFCYCGGGRSLKEISMTFKRFLAQTLTQ